MKLYQMLYEQDKKKNYTSYGPPDYGLSVWGNNSLILFHIPSFLKYLKNEKSATYTDVCAATIKVSDTAKKCMNALQVSIVAGSKKYPGAGITVYGLASDYYGAPLTSDRSSSSSVAARETWAKIETSPDWKITGDGLDNYAQVGNKKVYVDISGTYPNRSVKPRLKKDTGGVGGFFKNLLFGPETEPRTPDPSDDCPLPSKDGAEYDMKKMAELTGATNAYRYVGPNKAAPLVQRAQEFITETERDLILNPKLLNIEETLYKMSVQLFTNRYHGSDTPR